MEFVRYPEKATVERRETEMKVVSDFEDENGEHPEITVYPKKGLLLFDIDGTLLRAYPIHGKAIRQLYQEKFNVGVDPEIWFKNFGLGDYEEHRLLLEHYGIMCDETLINECKNAYGDYMYKALAEMTPEEKNEVIIPEAVAFLESAHTVNLPMGIVTGNTRRTTEGVMKHLGLAKYFMTGGYDSDVAPTSEGAFRRSIFLGIALKRCLEKMDNVAPPYERIVVVGDTPRDSKAAAVISPELKQILVATGEIPIDELQTTVEEGSGRRPDLVLPQLTKFDLFHESNVRQFLGEEGYQSYVQYLRHEKRHAGNKN